jgi:hypothetical protein
MILLAAIAESLALAANKYKTTRICDLFDLKAEASASRFPIMLSWFLRSAEANGHNRTRICDLFDVNEAL